jgi:hypothetical protein
VDVALLLEQQVPQVLQTEILTLQQQVMLVD